MLSTGDFIVLRPKQEACETRSIGRRSVKPQQRSKAIISRLLIDKRGLAVKNYTVDPGRAAGLARVGACCFAVSFRTGQKRSQMTRSLSQKIRPSTLGKSQGFPAKQSFSQPLCMLDSLQPTCLRAVLTRSTQRLDGSVRTRSGDPCPFRTAATPEMWLR